MIKRFCDRCKRELGLLTAIQIGFNRRTLTLCLKCKNEFYKFIGYAESGVPIIMTNKQEIIREVSIDKRLEDLKVDINSKRTQWTNIINKIIDAEAQTQADKKSVL